MGKLPRDSGGPFVQSCRLGSPVAQQATCSNAFTDARRSGIALRPGSGQLGRGAPRHGSDRAAPAVRSDRRRDLLSDRAQTHADASSRAARGFSREESDRAVRLARIAALGDSFSETADARGNRSVLPSADSRVAVLRNSPPPKQARASSRSCFTASTRAWRPRCSCGGSATIAPLRMTERFVRRTLAYSRPARGLLRAESSRRAARDPGHFEMDIQDLPSRYRLLKIEAPDDVQVEHVSVDHLPTDWPDRTEVTRALGDGWLTKSSAALLTLRQRSFPRHSMSC